MSATHRLFLPFALAAHESSLTELLATRGFRTPIRTEVALTGMPSATEAAVVCWAEPSGTPSFVVVDVMRVDDELLLPPLRYRYNVGHFEPVRARIAWRRRDGGAGADTVLEPRYVGGKITLVAIKPSAAVWVMTCKCGRFRYARRATAAAGRFPVYACRVCTRDQQLEAKTIRARQLRAQAAGMNTRQLGEEERDLIRRLAAVGHSQTAIARQLDRSRGAISRVLLCDRRKRT